MSVLRAASVGRQQPAALSISNRLAVWLAARDVHYGWVVAGSTFLVMLATAGAMGAPGVIIEPLEKEFGWSAADVSVAFAVRLALFGLVAPFAAAFLNRYGLRRVVAAAILMITAAILASLTMSRLWQLVALWGVIVGFGTGMVALVLGATVATRWFAERRGLVVGMLTASNATGQLVFLPLLAKLTQDHGWRSALGFVVVMLLVAGAIALLALRDRPFDVGLAPYGETCGRAAAETGSGLRGASHITIAGAMGSTVEPDLLGAVRDLLCVRAIDQRPHSDPLDLALRRLWRHAGERGGSAGRHRHFRLLRHLARAGSPTVMTTAGSCSFITDCGVCRLIALPFTNFSVVGLVGFRCFLRARLVATVPPTVRLTVERFGAERSNLTFGWIFAAHQLGAATAAFGAGASRTELSTYLPALYVAGVACIIAAALVLTLGPSRAAPRSGLVRRTLSCATPRRRRPRPEGDCRAFLLRPQSAPAGARDRTRAIPGCATLSRARTG